MFLIAYHFVISICIILHIGCCSLWLCNYLHNGISLLIYSYWLLIISFHRRINCHVPGLSLFFYLIFIIDYQYIIIYF